MALGRLDSAEMLRRTSIIYGRFTAATIKQLFPPNTGYLTVDLQNPTLTPPIVIKIFITGPQDNLTVTKGSRGTPKNQKDSSSVDHECPNVNKQVFVDPDTRQQACTP